MTKSAKISLMPGYSKRIKKRRSQKLNRGTTSRLSFTNKTRANIKRYAMISLLFGLSVLFMSGLGFWNYLNKNFVSASNPYGESLKDSLFPSFVYVVLDDIHKEIPEVKKINLVLLDTNTSRTYIYTIPLDLEFDVPGRYSKEQIKKVFALGSLNEENSFDSGVSLLLDTTFKLFAFKVDKYLIVEEEKEIVFDNFVIRGDFTGLLNRDMIGDLGSTMSTNLDLSEFYQLAVNLGNVPQERVLEKQFIVDFIDNPELLDREIREFTITSKLNEEKKSIAVLNGSDVQGVASFASRAIQNIGGRIVAVDNSKDKIENSYIIADNVSSETVNEIAELFGINSIIDKDSSGDFTYMDILDRSDIVVILGFDISKNL